MQNPVKRYRQHRELLDQVGHAGQSAVEFMVEVGMANTMVWLAKRAHKHGDRDTLERIHMMADAGTKAQEGVLRRRERAQRKARTMADAKGGRL